MTLIYKVTSRLSSRVIEYCILPDRYDESLRAFAVRLPGSDRPEFYLHPAVVRRNDTSARSVNEWTGERTLRDDEVPEDVQPASVQPLGNYAVQITWQDGFNQVCPFSRAGYCCQNAFPSMT